MSPPRAACLAVALLAMALKVMLPPGLMFEGPRNHLPFAIVLCTGYGPVKLEPGQALGEHGDKPASASPGHDSPCVFAGQGAMDAISDVFDVAAANVVYDQAVPFSPAPDLTPGRGLSAPPPPATGPPTA